MALSGIWYQIKASSQNSARVGKQVGNDSVLVSWSKLDTDCIEFSDHKASLAVKAFVNCARSPKFRRVIPHDAPWRITVSAQRLAFTKDPLECNWETSG